MADALTLRQLDTSPACYATIYEHPEFGKIDVGRLVQRSGQPADKDGWRWTIGWSTLQGRYWVQDTAPTMKAAREAWKRAWPAFRDARSEAEWHDAKADQDSSEKRIMIIDARKVPGLSKAQQAELDAEMARPGPAPHWLRQLLA